MQTIKVMRDADKYWVKVKISPSIRFAGSVHLYASAGPNGFGLCATPTQARAIAAALIAEADAAEGGE